MSRFSDNAHKLSRRDRFPEPKWMTDVDKRRLEDSLQSLMDAFNDIEYAVKDLIDTVDYKHYKPNYNLGQRLSSDFITLYNECEFLEDNYSADFNANSFSKRFRRSAY